MRNTAPTNRRTLRVESRRQVATIGERLTACSKETLPKGDDLPVVTASNPVLCQGLDSLQCILGVNREMFFPKPQCLFEERLSRGGKR